MDDALMTHTHQMASRNLRNQEMVCIVASHLKTVKKKSRNKTTKQRRQLVLLKQQKKTKADAHLKKLNEPRQLESFTTTMALQPWRMLNV